MGKRLILLTTFLCVIAFVLGLSNYKSEFKSDEVLNHKYLSQKMKDIKDQRAQEAERIKLAANGEAQPVIEDQGPLLDLDDPNIQAAIEIYTNGAGQCITCHGEKGEGNAEKQAPLIAGQHAWYLIDHLTQMKNGKRSIEAQAASFHAKISEDEIKTVSKYISLLRVE